MLAEPAEHPEDALQQPRLSALRHGGEQSPAVLAGPIDARRRGPGIKRTSSSVRSRALARVRRRATPEAGRSARTAVGTGSVGVPYAAPRMTVIGSWSPEMRRMASSMNRLDPTPAVPSISSVAESPAAAERMTVASFANASSRPTKRALVYVAGSHLPSYTAGSDVIHPGPNTVPRRTNAVTSGFRIGRATATLRA